MLKRHLDLLSRGDYCYRILVVLLENGCYTMTATGEIAAVISALMNSSGGVVAVQVDSARLYSQVDLIAFERNIVRNITEQHNWISKELFKTYVKPKISMQSTEVVFFVNKCEHLVTVCSNAFTSDQCDIQPVTEFHDLCSRLSKCTCVGGKKCEHHTGDYPVLQSALGGATVLKIDRPVPNPGDRKCWYRYYKLHGRSLNDALCTNSVKNDLWKLFSAVANGDGGSIFLGITNTDSPIVKGYSKADIDALGSSIDWEYYIHPVNGTMGENAVLEICVDKFPTGFFIDMPLCFEVDESGKVIALNDFDEWKGKMLRGYKSEPAKNEIPFEDHFRLEKVEYNDGLMDIPTYYRNLLTTQKPGATVDVTDMQSHGTSSASPLCLSTNEVGSGEWLRFDNCCARDLADAEIDIKAKFRLFPPTDAIAEMTGHAALLRGGLREIKKKYQDSNGIGCVIIDELDYCKSVTVSRPRYHLCDIILLRENHRPSIISVVGNDVDQKEVIKYSAALALFLKEECVQTYGELCDNTSHLSFQRQLFDMGKGFKVLEDEVSYPKEYLQPTLGTLNSVRYVLASIFLRCEPIKDRFGDILVRHLTSCQAGVLWGKWLKVNVVEGKAGSGKSILILETMRRIKHHGEGSKILYLCRGKGLAAFVQYQCHMMDICVKTETIVEEAKEHMTEEYLSEYTDIFIDDAHALPMLGEPNCLKMYNSLLASLRSPKSRLYIFLDLDMQDYRGCISVNFTKQIAAMTRKYPFLRHELRTECLGKVLRNSHRICHFINSNTEGEELEEIHGIRNLPDDNVFLQCIQSLSGSHFDAKLQNSTERHAKSSISQYKTRESDMDPDDEYDSFMQYILDDEERRKSPDTLLTRLNKILKLPRYHERHIAVLTGTTEDKMLALAALHSASLSTQDATTFPVKHLVVDTLESFEGLESPVILFIVPESWGTGYVGSLKYRLCIATRAVSRLEFLIPWDMTGRQQDLVQLRRAFGKEVKLLYKL